MLEIRRDKITVLVSEPDNGIYDGMNKGIGRATGDVIGILNADDQYSDPFVIRDVLQAFSDAKTDACYGNMVYIDEAGKVVRYWKAGPPRRANWYLAGHLPIRHSSCAGTFMTSMAHSTPDSRLRLTMN